MIPLDPPEDLASDLEWMLRSGQAGAGALAEALTRAYYPALVRFCLARLGEPQAAGCAALDTLAAAVARAYQFQNGAQAEGEVGVRLWLFRLALEVTNRASRRLAFSPPPEQRRVQGRDRTEPDLPRADALRLPLILHRALGWSVSEVARLLQLPEAQVRERVERAEARLRAAAPRAELEQELAAAWPAPDLTPEDLAALADEVAAGAGRQAARLRRGAAAREILLVLAAAVLVLGLFRGAEMFFPAPSPTPVPTRPRVVRTAEPFDLVVEDPRATALADSIERSRLRQTAAAPRFRYTSVPGDTWERLAAELGLDPDRLAEANGSGTGRPLPPYLRLDLPGLVPPWLRPPQAEPPPIPPGPLVEAGFAAEIYAFLASGPHRWNRLWMDVQTTYYGPAGYVGPPLSTHREQAWLHGPDWIVSISGPAGLYGAPAQPFLTTGGLLFGLDDQLGGIVLHRLGEEALAWGAAGMAFPNRTALWQAGGKIERAGTESYLGRPAVMVDWTPIGGGEVEGLPARTRLWLDVGTGMILRRQDYGGLEGSVLLADVRLIGLEIDGDFPPPDFFDLTNPRLQAFAADGRGSPLPPGAPTPAPPADLAPRPRLALSLPPADFDPASSWLTFQYPAHHPAELGGGNAVVELFADSYFLSALEFPGPWAAYCDRSHDGRRLAFINQGNLYWIDLSNPNERRAVPEPFDIEPQEFAFDPTGRRLAFFGTPRSSAQAALYLYDTGTEAVSRLTQVLYADSLAWSPDGQFLTYLSSSGARQEVVVLRVATRRVVYHAPVGESVARSGAGRAPGWPAPDWPGHEWGIPFPVYRHGLERCAAPPGVKGIGE